MEENKYSKLSYKVSFHSTKYQSWYLFAQMKFICVVSLVFMMLPNAGKLSCSAYESAVHDFDFHFNFSFFCFHMIAAAYDPLDPNGNITIKWDVMSWTPDGYVVSRFVSNP